MRTATYACRQRYFRGSHYDADRLTRSVAINRTGSLRLSAPVPRPDMRDTGVLFEFIASRRRITQLFTAPDVLAWRPLPLASALYETLERHVAWSPLPSVPPSWSDAAPLADARHGGSLRLSPGRLQPYSGGAIDQARANLRMLEELAGAETGDGRATGDHQAEHARNSVEQVTLLRSGCGVKCSAQRDDGD